MKKATHKTERASIRHFQQIINIGPASEQDFRLLGFDSPQDLIGRCPWDLFCQLSEATNIRQDPCVLDVLISSVDFMNGNRPKKWWLYTKQRKRDFGNKLEELHSSV